MTIKYVEAMVLDDDSTQAPEYQPSRFDYDSKDLREARTILSDLVRRKDEVAPNDLFDAIEELDEQVGLLLSEVSEHTCECGHGDPPEGIPLVPVGTTITIREQIDRWFNRGDEVVVVKLADWREMADTVARQRRELIARDAGVTP